MNTVYNLDYTPRYETDEEYQTAIRIVFGMPGEDYDDELISKSLDFLYANTKETEEFKEIYGSSAAKIMSEDQEMGIAVLFSYDFFREFHALLVAHFAKTDIAEWVAAVKAKLSEK